MGTNFYAEFNKCECCNRSNKIHIGKSSWGWAFHFRGYDGQYGYIEDSDDKTLEVPEDFQLKSWKQWKEYLKDNPIIDEYGEAVSYEEFVEMVETYKSPGFVRDDGHRNLDHIDEILKEQRYADIWREYRDEDVYWHDEDGYSFSSRYFS
jgi:hypothetical protein